jgi:hypothetical protein
MMNDCPNDSGFRSAEKAIGFFMPNFCNDAWKMERTEIQTIHVQRVPDDVQRVPHMVQRAPDRQQREGAKAKREARNQQREAYTPECFGSSLQPVAY